MDAPELLDAAAVAALPPAAAVEAITATLRAGFDPADDTPRTGAPTTHGQFLFMPSEIGDVAGVKVVTIAPDNPSAGLPRIQASYLLYDARTLALRAILDGTALTTLRTPAVSVAAVRPMLARFSEPLRVVVVGGGPQAVGHADTLAAAAPLADDQVTFLLRRPDAASSAVRDRGAVLAIDSDAASAEISDADVVVCATSARTPLFDGDLVADGAVVIAIGAHEPDARELDSSLMARSTVVVEDHAAALREAGDVVLAIRDGVLDPDDLVPMRDVVTGSVMPPGDRPVVFKGTGMSWQDLSVASAVLAGRTG